MSTCRFRLQELSDPAHQWPLGCAPREADDSCRPDHKQFSGIGFGLCDQAVPAALPPDELDRGLRPGHAARSRPDLKAAGSTTLAAIVDAVITPTPGIVASRWLAARAVPSRDFPPSSPYLGIQGADLSGRGQNDVTHERRQVDLVCAVCKHPLDEIGMPSDPLLALRRPSR